MPGSIKRFEKQFRAVVIAATLLVVASIGCVDYVAGRELSFSVFYLFAVGIATWYLGARFALGIAILSVMVSLAGDLAIGGRYSNRLVPWWNVSITLVFYLFVIALLARLRAVQGILEARVKERTAALRDEMAERERVERELLAISENEQRRIGHDLHDSLGQHLTGVALAGQVLEETLSARGLPEAVDAGKLVDLIEEGISLTRNLAKGLHPIEFETDGLMLALEELAASSSDLFKVACTFECDSPVIVRDRTASGHLYRIAQEAISNSVKHGKSRHISLQLEALDTGIALRVKDDGCGLPDPLPTRAGMGLRIMAHRASIIGGTFEARCDGSGGTLIAVLLRYPEPTGGNVP